MYQNNTADYRDGKIDAERHAERQGVFNTVAVAERMAVEAVESAAYIAGYRIRTAQLARAAGYEELDDWVGPGS